MQGALKPRTIPTAGRSGFRVALRDPGMTSTGDRLHKLVSYFATTRNDLQPPALNLQPVIADAIAALEQSGALLARMSGSGATCFGIFADEEAKEHAGIAIRQAHPDWWIG